eukprot:SAG31_NODE_8282_length_1481_cov_1.399421_1_plen_131_part_00
MPLIAYPNTIAHPNFEPGAVICAAFQLNILSNVGRVAENLEKWPICNASSAKPSDCLHHIRHLFACAVGIGADQEEYMSCAPNANYSRTRTSKPNRIRTFVCANALFLRRLQTAHLFVPAFTINPQNSVT